jgi:hypothetical protein
MSNKMPEPMCAAATLSIDHLVLHARVHCIIRIRREDYPLLHLPQINPHNPTCTAGSTPSCRAIWRSK